MKPYLADLVRAAPTPRMAVMSPVNTCKPESWALCSGPAPNMTLLNNALRQTGWTGAEITAETWRPVLADRLQRLHWDRVVDDVRPLLDVGADLALLTRENVLRVVTYPRSRTQTNGIDSAAPMICRPPIQPRRPWPIGWPASKPWPPRTVSPVQTNHRR